MSSDDEYEYEKASHKSLPVEATFLSF